MNWKVLLSFAVFSLSVAGCGDVKAPPIQSLKISSLSELVYVDPQKVSNDSDYKIIYSVFEGLVVPDPETMQPLPGVAERWTVSADGKTYEFFLRDSAKWSNGTPIVADDFVYSAKRALSSKLSCAFVELFFPVRNAKEFFAKKIRDFSKVGICAVNSRTLKIELEESTPYFLSMLMHPCWFPMTDSVEKSFKKYSKEIHSRSVSKVQIISNGPFCFSERIPGSSLLLVRNPHYWDVDNVLLNMVVFYFDLSRGESIKMLHEKELDIVELILDSDTINCLHCDGEEEMPSPLFECFALALNTTHPIGADKRIRLALSLAIDREKLVSKIEKNKAIAAYNFIPRIEASYASKPLFERNVELAQKLLKESGYTTGDDVPPLKILCDEAELGLNVAVIEQIISDWKSVLGINGRVDSRDLGSFIDRRKKMRFDVVKISYRGMCCDPASIIDSFSSGHAKNYGQWSDLGYDEIVKGMHSALGVEECNKFIRLAEARLVEEMPIIPLFFNSKSYLVEKRVRGWFPSAINIHPLKFVYFD